MELFELYSKEKAIFCLKLLFIKVSCVVNVNKKCFVSLEMDEEQQNG